MYGTWKKVAWLKNGELVMAGILGGDGRDMMNKTHLSKSCIK